MKTIIDDWDCWRNEIKQDGDPDNERMSRKERKSRELVNVVTEEYIPTDESPIGKKKVEQWVNELNEDAQFNVSSYTECFISENLLRKYLKEKTVSLPSDLVSRISKWKDNHIKAKEVVFQTVCLG